MMPSDNVIVEYDRVVKHCQTKGKSGYQILKRKVIRNNFDIELL